MDVIISNTKEELGKKAASKGSELINRSIIEKGYANIIVATGASQFEMLQALVSKQINWSKVTGFHLDEYIGIQLSHQASFRKYLKERFADKINIKKFHYVNGEYDPEKECTRLDDLILKHPIDVAFVGIGENSHLAFNDPPADFETEKPYLIVDLDEDCKKQQMGEGWFKTLKEVPKQAISMSIKQILKSKFIICSVPDERKAWAVKHSIEGEITPMIPASILQTHSNTSLYLDKNSSSQLTKSI